MIQEVNSAFIWHTTARCITKSAIFGDRTILTFSMPDAKIYIFLFVAHNFNSLFLFFCEAIRFCYS